MKVAVVVLFCIVAAVSASQHYGFDKPENFARERQVNHVNGARQANVNYIAESVGASSGTFRVAGVPGTGVGGYGYNRGYAGYGYPGYQGYDGRYAGYGY